MPIDCAFTYCNQLSKVYYGGTEVQWNLIAGSGENNGLKNEVLYWYSGTQPAEAGNCWHYVDGEPAAW